MCSRWTVLIVLVTVAVFGCGRTPSAEGPAEGAGTESTEIVATETAFFLCGDCGEMKETEVCCVEGAKKCDECGLIAGSPGCCKIEKGTDAKLCTKCGQIAGSDTCCKADAEKCDKCQLAKGSPGCCKIKT